MDEFNKNDLKKLHKPAWESTNEENGQVTIIGGSELFHGAPILSLKTTSRIVDMVFFSSVEKNLSDIVNKMKSDLLSFIWVPWDEIGEYIAKSDAVLIGPGFMRYEKETQNPKGKNKYDKKGSETRDITKKLLLKFAAKRWVIDAGSLQVMDAEWIPKDAVLTPNEKEFNLLFKSEYTSANVESMARKYDCVIVKKSPETLIASAQKSTIVKGGNPGLTKGGTGDVLAGLTLALLAKNEPFLAACAASYIAKTSADHLYKKVGTNFNADDLANAIPETFHSLLI